MCVLSLKRAGELTEARGCGMRVGGRCHCGGHVSDNWGGGVSGDRQNNLLLQRSPP